jgi:putative hydrolase of the HAD superfamily
MTNPIRVILFDVGGVIVELSGIQIIQAWMKNRWTQEEIWRMWLTSSIVRDFESGRIEPDTFADRIIVELRLPISRQEFLMSFTTWPKRVIPGVVDIINKIPKNIIRATL